MISMKVQKKESKQSGNPARSLILVTVCTCTAIAFAAGGRIADFNGKNKVYAASENRGKTFSSDADETDVLPTGIAGVVSGMNDTASPKKSVTRIGTSCEQVMVGQRIKVIEDNMAEFDVSSSMESSINELDARTTALAESARMMSDEDYDTLLHIVEAEAGTEDVKGRILVANVIMNRIKNKEFPDTVTEVVWQNTNGVPQFSPTYDGRINEVSVTDETREAVRQALEGVDYSEGALFFIQKSEAESQNVSWFEKDLKRLFKYGVHEFYTYPDSAESSTGS